MFSHIMVGVNDLDKSRTFYDALLGTLGVPAGVVDDNRRAFYFTDTGIFSITKPIDGQSATHANGGTIGFAMASAAMAQAWHDAGVANGGTSIEDPPGVRPNATGGVYLAYLRDPDGNKLCAVHRNG